MSKIKVEHERFENLAGFRIFVFWKIFQKILGFIALSSVHFWFHCKGKRVPFDPDFKSCLPAGRIFVLEFLQFYSLGAPPRF